jgi:hypothetical protein
MSTHAELEHLERRKRSTDEQPPAARDSRAHVLALQRSAGNAAVGRMLSNMRDRTMPPPAPATPSPMETRTETQSFQFGAAIRIGAGEERRPQRVAAGADTDNPRDQHIHEELPAIEAIAGEPLAATTMAAPPQAPPSAAPAPASAEGGAAPTGGGDAKQEAPVSLPDIEVRDFEQVELCDAITPWLSYSGTISQGGATPNGYGVTRPGPMTVTGITVRKLPVVGWWYVSATITQAIQWQVRAVTGPTGEINIGSSLDPAITAANWQTVVSDLTPDMSDLNGRPPRTQFWAKDLTEQHEQFHANDRKTRAPAALRLASNWLGTQQAADVPGVQALLAQVPGRMVATVSAGMTMPGKEERAYGDGAGAYSRRATAIWALGKVGYY